MNPNSQNLRQVQKEQLETESIQKSVGKEFANVEELLRHDSGENPVPPEVAHRLNQSIAAEPKPEKSWWQKIFSGS